VDMTWLMLYCP